MVSGLQEQNFGNIYPFKKREKVLDNQETISFKYFFELDDGESKQFSIELDSKTLNIVSKENLNKPEWTKLDNYKCSKCPFDSEKTKYCPIALNMSELIGEFKKYFSYEKVNVTITTDGRQFKKRSTIQESLSSIIGIYMVTSGCPIMQKLKPMVRHHLPFASLDETNYRVLSMYLLGQYFVYKRGGSPDWDMNELVKFYEDIKNVNKCFCNRLSEIQAEDASLNAVVILDTFADYIPFSLSENMLEEVELMFGAYLS